MINFGAIYLARREVNGLLYTPITTTDIGGLNCLFNLFH